MSAVLSIIAIIALVGTLFFVGCKTGSFTNPEKKIPAKTMYENSCILKSPSKDEVKSLSRSEIERLLANIENSPPPEEVVNAMCYSQAVASKNVDYICPDCGEKTIYDKWKTTFFLYSLPDIKETLVEFRNKTKLDVCLDISTLCSHCTPNVTERAAFLIFAYDDGTYAKYRVGDSEDFETLEAFLDGKLALERGRGEKYVDVYPLKKMLNRLRKLLPKDNTEPKKEDKQLDQDEDY